MLTNTEFTWILVTFVLFMGFAQSMPLHGLVLVWGSSELLQIPFTLATSLMGAFPLLSPLFLLAFLYYFAIILPGAVGEGYQMFIVAAVIILMVGI